MPHSSIFLLVLLTMSYQSILPLTAQQTEQVNMTTSPKETDATFVLCVYNNPFRSQYQQQQQHQQQQPHQQQYQQQQRNQQQQHSPCGRQLGTWNPMAPR